MRYKIKITTFKNGRQEFRAYFRKRFRWVGLWADGNTTFTYVFGYRDGALKAIDLHFNGNNVLEKIEFEYITK